MGPSILQRDMPDDEDYHASSALLSSPRLGESGKCWQAAQRTPVLTAVKAKTMTAPVAAIRNDLVLLSTFLTTGEKVP
jgi:hypothetical protein